MPLPSKEEKYSAKPLFLTVHPDLQQIWTFYRHNPIKGACGNGAFHFFNYVNTYLYKDFHNIKEINKFSIYWTFFITFSVLLSCTQFNIESQGISVSSDALFAWLFLETFQAVPIQYS